MEKNIMEHIQNKFISRTDESIKYEITVLDELVKKLKSEGVEESRIRKYYRLNTKPHFELDLVVLKEDCKGIAIAYDVKTFNVVKRNPNFIFDKLQKYKQWAGIDDARIVYIDDNGQLHVDNEKSLTVGASSNRKELTKTTSENRFVKDYSEFYKIIKNDCLIEEPKGLRFFFRGHNSIIQQCLCGIYRNDNLLKRERAFLRSY